MNTNTKTTGKPIWRDLFSSDLKASAAFYGEVFGWKVREEKMDGGRTYTMFSIDGKDVAGAMSEAQAKGVPSHWNSYLTTPNVDESVKKIESLGGKRFAGPLDIPEVGRFATTSDPMGAFFSMLTPNFEAPDERCMPPLGHFCWLELHTSDIPHALAFYKDVFGYTEIPTPSGSASGGEYHQLARDPASPVPAIGIMKKPMAEAPSAFLAYVHVDDVDATVKRAESNRGKLLLAPTDIPKVGRIAVVTDVTGAPIGFFKALSA